MAILLPPPGDDLWWLASGARKRRVIDFDPGAAGKPITVQARLLFAALERDEQDFLLEADA